MSNTLKFSCYAWLKMLWMLYKGDHEIGGFGLCPKDRLTVEDIVIPKQEVTSVTVELDSDFMDGLTFDMSDKKLHHNQWHRVWCHTHPGNSAEPSGVDWGNLNDPDKMGSQDWGVMFILARDTSWTCHLRTKSTDGLVSVTRIPVTVAWGEFPEAIQKITADLPTWEEHFKERVSEKSWRSSSYDWRKEVAEYDRWWEERLREKCTDKQEQKVRTRDSVTKPGEQKWIWRKFWGRQKGAAVEQIQEFQDRRDAK